MTPTLAGFLVFIRSTMGISTAILPDNSQVITDSYNVAIEIVNLALNSASSTIYTLAVYNLAGSNLINFAQDTPPSTYFAEIRTKWNINNFISGVVQSSGDEGTNQSLLVPEFMKNFTLANLQQAKDPFGRQYIMFAQSFGPTVFGMN